MSKIYILLHLFFIFLSSDPLIGEFDTPEVYVYNVSNLGYQDINIYDEDIYIRLFYTYLTDEDIDENTLISFDNISENTEFNYNYQIITKYDVNIDFKCNNEIVYSNSISPILHILDYRDTIINNNYVGICDIYNDEITVIVTDSNGEKIYEYVIDGLNSLLSESTFVQNNEYTHKEFNDFIYLYVGLIILVITLIATKLYINKYKKHINLQLSDKTYKRKIVDPPNFIIRIIIVVITIFIISSGLLKYVFENTYTDLVHYNWTTNEIFYVDTEGLLYLETEYYKIEATGMGSTLFENNYIITNYLVDTDFGEIEPYIINLLESMNGNVYPKYDENMSIYGMNPSVLGDDKYTISIQDIDNQIIEIIIRQRDEAPDELVCEVIVYLSDSDYYLRGFINEDIDSNVESILSYLKTYEEIIEE